MSEPTAPPPPYYTPPPPPGGPTSGTVSPNRTIMIILSYLGILSLIPFLTEKEDREVAWHARNGLALFVAEIIVFVVLWVVQMVLIVSHFLAFLGCLVSIVYLVVVIGLLVVHVMCIVKGLQGQRFIIPMVSQYADKF